MPYESRLFVAGEYADGTGETSVPVKVHREVVAQVRVKVVAETV